MARTGEKRRRSVFATYHALEDVMTILKDLKDSAPDKRIPFTMQFRTEVSAGLETGIDLCYAVDVFNKRDPYFVEWVQVDDPLGSGYRLEQWGAGRGPRWVYKFRDYSGLKSGAIEHVAHFLRERAMHSLLDGEVIMVEDLFGQGMFAAQWTPKDFLAPWADSVEHWKPTEAIYRAYSFVAGKLCWSGELEDWGFRSGALVGEQAVGFVADLLPMLRKRAPARRKETKWLSERTAPGALRSFNIGIRQPAKLKNRAITTFFIA